MRSIKVMIVDDSPLFRRALTKALEALPGVQVVGTCPDGAQALERLPEWKPDLITLDLEMPGMGGIETLRRLRTMRGKHRVLIVSAHSTSGARLTVEALCHGADDFITKLPGEGASGLDNLRQQLQAKLDQLFAPPAVKAASRPVSSLFRATQPEVVLIGVSTGGPNALSELFETLPGNLPVPILIVQHMPPHFTKLLSERLSAKGTVPVTEAQDGEPILAGRAYVAPGDFHMELQALGKQRRIHLHQAPKVHSCRPAVDLLFRSAAKIYRSSCLAVIMTGMGSDGALGAQAVSEVGGEILIQDAASSVVYGMPGAVQALGVRHQVVELSRMGAAIADRVRGSRMVSGRA